MKKQSDPFVGQLVGERKLTPSERSGQSVEQFISHFGIVLKTFDRDRMRMLKPVTDFVRGMPHFGEVTVRATDGANVYAEVLWHDHQPVVVISRSNFLGKLVSPNTKDGEDKEDSSYGEVKVKKEKKKVKKKERLSEGEAIRMMKELLTNLPTA